MDFIKKMLADAAELRQGVFEFQGFEREFLLFQEQLLREYSRSSGLKHPTNRGDAREDHLRAFFTAYSLIPEKFGISETSSRIVSTSGHHSEEIDLVFFDKPNNISLLKYESAEFFPVETVHGIVQVKSNLSSKKLVKDGLRNIASFKRLRKPRLTRAQVARVKIETEATRGFGVLFAFKAKLKWLTLVNAIKEFMAETPSTEWPNAVVILDEGIILPFDGEKGVFLTNLIDKLTDAKVMGSPDQGDTLLSFYSVLMTMLENSFPGQLNISSYFRLPLLAGEVSYEYSFGAASEVGTCEKHGQYLREISQDALCKIVDVCSEAEAINWIKATDIAYGRDTEDVEKYERQPGDVYIYNPENRDLSEILVFQKPPYSLSFDSIVVSGKTYWIPYLYSLQDDLIPIECPVCIKNA